MLDDGILGMPDTQAEFCEPQIFPDNCAVCAETSILNQCIPGLDLDQIDAAQISASNDWYVPGEGTSPDVIGNLLESHGIETHTVHNATVEQLASEVMQGHGVIVGVNSGDLWAEGPLAELKNFLYDTLGLPADHAIVVTGFDVSDPANPQVIINDSGVLDGAGVRYPLDKFVDAWQNSDFYYVATDAPIQEYAQQSIIQNALSDGFGLVDSSAMSIFESGSAFNTPAFHQETSVVPIAEFVQDDDIARSI